MSPAYTYGFKEGESKDMKSLKGFNITTGENESQQQIQRHENWSPGYTYGFKGEDEDMKSLKGFKLTEEENESQQIQSPRTPTPKSESDSKSGEGAPEHNRCLFGAAQNFPIMPPPLLPTGLAKGDESLRVRKGLYEELKQAALRWLSEVYGVEDVLEFGKHHTLGEVLSEAKRIEGGEAAPGCNPNPAEWRLTESSE